MKKIYVIIFTVILNLGFYSCTPQELAVDESSQQACCDDGDDIPPPPPPPPPGGGNG